MRAHLSRQRASHATGRRVADALGGHEHPLLRVQRAIGNRAMSRLLDGDRRDGELPSTLRHGVERLSGVSLDGVRVHRGSSKPAAVGAEAYTQDREIHLAPGREHHLPHEAWHVVQQLQGRVPATRHQGARLNDDPKLEREADVMGARAAQSNAVATPAAEPAPAAVAPSGGVIQRKPVSTTANTRTITLHAEQTDVYQYVVDGHLADSRDAVVPMGQGPIRYLRTDGVFDCIAVARQGVRADLRPVSLFAHVSSRAYLRARSAPSPAMVELANFETGLSGVQRVAATTYQDHAQDITQMMREGMQDVPLHNVRPFAAGAGDFIFDTFAFALHMAGRRAANATEDAVVGDDVSEFMTQQRHWANYGHDALIRRQREAYNHPEARARRLAQRILFVVLALVALLLLRWALSGSGAPPKLDAPPTPPPPGPLAPS